MKDHGLIKSFVSSRRRAIRMAGWTCSATLLFSLTPGGIPAAVSSESDDQRIAAQSKALSEILIAADKICTSTPIEHHEEKVELSGDAKAQLAGVLAKVVDLGINGAAKYTKGDSKGVIQEQLAESIKNGNNCKLDVLKTLKTMIPGLT